jgi:hypothetical protein
VPSSPWVRTVSAHRSWQVGEWFFDAKVVEVGDLLWAWEVTSPFGVFSGTTMYEGSAREMAERTVTRVAHEQGVKLP